MITDLTPSTMVSHPNPVPHSLPTGPRRAYRQHSEIYNDPAGQTTTPILLDPIADSGPLRSSTRQHEYRFSVDEKGAEVDVRSIPDVSAAWVFSPHLYHVHDWGPEPTTWAEAMATPYAESGL